MNKTLNRSFRIILIAILWLQITACVPSTTVVASFNLSEKETIIIFEKLCLDFKEIRILNERIHKATTPQKTNVCWTKTDENFSSMWTYSEDFIYRGENKFGEIRVSMRHRSKDGRTEVIFSQLGKKFSESAGSLLIEVKKILDNHIGEYKIETY